MRYTLAGLSDIALSGSYVKPGGTATYEIMMRMSLHDYVRISDYHSPHAHMYHQCPILQQLQGLKILESS